MLKHEALVRIESEQENPNVFRFPLSGFEYRMNTSETLRLGKTYSLDLKL
jgi:hypothetical protein